jgi:hypothetical protein
MIQKMVYLFPSETIRSQLSNEVDLNNAVESECMIGVLCALRQFAVSGTGNVEVNRALAEERLLNIFMTKDVNFVEYVSRFKAAVKDLELLGSTWSVKKIVDIFMRNLDQSQLMFNDIYSRYLDKSYPEVFKLQHGSLQDAIDAMSDHYNMVVRVAHTYVGRVAASGVGKPHIYSSSKQLAKALADPSSAPGDLITVPRVILATVLNNSKRKAGDNSNLTSQDKGKKVRNAVDDATKRRVDNVDKLKKDPADKKVRFSDKPCHQFAREGKCDRGSTCWFAH